ncbi:hypothetical protein ACJX0J_040516, partial [Zea mays]
IHQNSGSRFLLLLGENVLFMVLELIALFLLSSCAALKLNMLIVVLCALGPSKLIQKAPQEEQLQEQSWEQPWARLQQSHFELS